MSTLYVDAKTGDNFTAEKGNINKPYQTLSFALKHAQSKDTLYIQPGKYHDDNLILKNKVDWYYTSGAIHKGKKTLFIVEKNVNCSITGFGSFKSKKNILKQKKGKSNIILEGNSFESSDDMFYFYNRFNNKSTFKISGKSFIGTNIFHISQNLDVIFNFVEIITSNKIFQIDLNATGSFIGCGNKIIRTSTTSDSGISIMSTSFNMNLDVQNYVSVNASINPNASSFDIDINGNANSIFNFEQFTTTTAILRTNGNNTTFFNCVNLNNTNLTYSNTISLFEIDGGNVFINGTNLSQNGLSNIFNILNNASLTATITTLNFSATLCSSNTAGNIILTIENINNPLIDTTALLNMFTNSGSGDFTYNIGNININNTNTTFINNIFYIANSSTNQNNGNINVANLNVNFLATNCVICGDYTTLKINGKNWNINTTPDFTPTCFGVNANVSNMYIDVDHISIPGRIIYSNTGGRISFYNKSSIQTNDSGTVDSEMFQFISGTQLNLKGGSLIMKGFGNTLEFLASCSGRSKFDYIETQYRAAYLNTFGSIWHYCDKTVSSSSSVPVIGIQTAAVSQINNNIHTIGGYMSTQYNHVIEIINGGNNLQFPGLRLLGSILVGTTPNNLAIFNDPTLPVIQVTTQPSSANCGVVYTTGLNGEVQIIPINSLFVDPNVI